MVHSNENHQQVLRINDLNPKLQHDPIRQGFDVLHDPVFGDFTSDVGFLKGIELTLRLVVDGLLFGGLPCGSFGFLSSPTHARTSADPWGNLKHPFVLIGNICSTRFAILVCLSVVRGATWMLEQPGRTALTLLPPIRLLLQSRFKPRLVKWRGPQNLIETCTNMMNESKKIAMMCSTIILLVLKLELHDN